MARLDQGIVNLLENSVGSKIENFELTVHAGNQKGEGFLGEMIFVSLKNKHTGEDYNLMVKNARFSETEKTRTFMTLTYFHEIYYYTKIFPALENFQKYYPHIRKFDNYAKCYATTLKPGFEKLVLENLKIKEYELHPKAQPMDQKMVEKLFRNYADLHAAGYAFKHHQPELFRKLTKVLKNNWLYFAEMNDLMKSGIQKTFLMLEGFLEDEGENKIIKKFEKYSQNGFQVYIDSLKYNGSNGTILHGDAWSNNFMFKYNAAREVEDVKLLDFQLGSVATPVMDLSYNFYSSVGTECLEKLDYFLKFYHKNLCENLEKYGCNPEEIYPYEILKKDWKEQCQFGFVMGTLIWGTKLATDLSEMPTINEIMDKNDETQVDSDYGIKYDEVEFRRRALDLIRHMYENDFL